MSSDQECFQCGKCCERWGWGQSGVIDDLIPWLVHNRQDILQHVAIRFSNGSRISGRFISPDDLPRIARIIYWQGTDGTYLRECPFFWKSNDGKSWCKIHDIKPQVCREFTPWKWQNHEFYGYCPACRDKSP